MGISLSSQVPTWTNSVDPRVKSGQEWLIIKFKLIGYLVLNLQLNISPFCLPFHQILQCLGNFFRKFRSLAFWLKIDSIITSPEYLVIFPAWKWATGKKKRVQFFIFHNPFCQFCLNTRFNLFLYLQQNLAN